MVASLSRRLAWISRDARLMIAAHSARAFSRDLITVFLAIYLDGLGFSLVQIGAFLSAGLAGSALYSILVAFIAEVVGRRRLLVLLTMLRGVVGIALVLSDNFLLLTVLGFLGGFSGGGAGGGAVIALETASLAETAPSQRRTDLFSVYNLIAILVGSLGALSAGLPDLYRNLFDLGDLAAMKVAILTYVFFVVLAALFSGMLSSAVEVGAMKNRWVNPLRLPSRRRIFSLAGLYSVDSFGDGLIVQSLVSLWLFTKFDLQVTSLGLVFFFTHLGTSLFVGMGAILARRFGLIRTMVATHLFSNLLLLALPFAPNVWLALLFWLTFFPLSHMSWPLRQSYTLGIVAPDERVAMGTANNLGRSASSTVAPSVATFLWTVASSSVPFVASAIVKTFQDVALYTAFRNVRPPEELERLKVVSTESSDRELSAADEAGTGHQR